MEPKDRVEQVVKTKFGARREAVSEGDREAPGARHRVTQEQFDAIIATWPPAPQKVVPELVERYGLPNEATPTLLIWHDSGPWKRTIVTSDETAHDFPTPHTDYVSQTLSYDVPLETIADVLALDGSLLINRTAGQVTSSCDNEASNFIAVNVMHDVVTGRLTVEAAREELADQKAAWALSRPAPYAEGLRFAAPQESETGDRDEPIMKGPAMRQAIEKVKDVVGLGDG